MSNPWPPTVGNAKATGAEGLTAPAPLVVWATAASNVGPRRFHADILERGPIGWVRDVLVPKLRSQTIDAVILAYPGGQEDGSKDLTFDMVSRCLDSTNPQVRACGDYAAWADACTILKESLGCKVGFYLGTAATLSRGATLHECETIIAQWGATADFVVIDCLGDRGTGTNDVLAANRLAAAEIPVWGEPRPTRGSVLLPVPYVCYSSKWESSGGALGDQYHTPLASVQAQGANVILIDEDGRMHPSTVAGLRTQGVGVCVGVDRVPIVASIGGVV